MAESSNVSDSDEAWKARAAGYERPPSRGETPKLERFTKKPWGTYPRCQHVNDYGKQCTATTYADDLCYGHCQDALRTKGMLES